MPLPNFVVTGNLNEILGLVEGDELVESALTRAQVQFRSNMPGDHFLTWDNNLYRIDDNTINARVNIAGDIVNDDDEPVRLLAQDDGLNIRNLQWQVRIKLQSTLAPPRVGTTMRSWWFNAGVDGTIIDLEEVVPVVAQPVYGVSPSPGGGGGTGTRVYGDTPVGTKNGINTVFTVDPYEASTTGIFRNGLRQIRTVDYTESSSTTITFSTAPVSTDDLLIDYNPPGGTDTRVYGDTPTGTKNGINTIFTLGAYASSSPAVFRNGLRQIRTVDYTESSSTTITFSTAPVSTDDLLVDYNPA